MGETLSFEASGDSASVLGTKACGWSSQVSLTISAKPTTDWDWESINFDGGEIEKK